MCVLLHCSPGGDARFRQWEKGRRDRFNAKLEELANCCQNFAAGEANAAAGSTIPGPGPAKCPSKVTLKPNLISRNALMTHQKSPYKGI